MLTRPKAAGASGHFVGDLEEDCCSRAPHFGRSKTTVHWTLRLVPVVQIVSAVARADRRRTRLRLCGFSLAQAVAANSLAEWPEANTITLLRTYDVLVR